MKTIFKKIHVLIVLVLACLLLVLYQVSNYLSQQQEKARIQASINEEEDGTLNNYYHPEADSIPEHEATSEATKFVENETATPPITRQETTAPAATAPTAVPVNNPTKPAIKEETKPRKAEPKLSAKQSTPKPAAEKRAEVGDYFVIAGSFSSKQNAKAKLKEVMDKGFSNAKLVSFKSGKLVSVCLRTYPTEIQANAYSKQVKEKYDIATIVKRGSKKR